MPPTNGNQPPPFIPPPQPNRTTDLGIRVGSRLIRGPACKACGGSFWHTQDCLAVDS